MAGVATSSAIAARPLTPKQSRFVKRNVTSGDGQTDLTYKVTLWDKGKAIEMEYKHFGLLVEKLDASDAITIIHELPD